VGAAGVGKSAIMQSVVEDKSNDLSDIIVGATIFFSIDGCQDGTKTIMIIACQLAVNLESYRQFVQGEVTPDPSLLQKSLQAQYENSLSNRSSAGICWMMLLAC
jgi:GTPase SAR1 family protein